MRAILKTPFVGAWLLLAAAAEAQPVDFNSQIRPILNQNCTSCHGGVKAAGEISFVYADVVRKTGKKSGRPVIVPGKPDESELIARVTSADKEYRMPPADHGAALPADKIALLRRWIQEGAAWQDHWAFVPPAAQPVPPVPASMEAAARSPVDRFLFARLARENLAPAREAPRAALLRRVSFDLTGLPPTAEETAAFVQDNAPDAFERRVDRLLASPRFGERWASLWLDLARYADTRGYEKDDTRNVWPYRDWLVAALNRNMRYDEFMIEQLAGDLLPAAGMRQHVATAFHRLTQVNDEGGTDDEEYRIAAVVDRVATTWQVTNAVTFACVQCHDHPYDPIRHREYYEFFAFFNGSRDTDLVNEHPTLRIPDNPRQSDEAWQLRREVETLRREVVAAGRDAAADEKQWRPLAITAAKVTPDAEVTLHAGAVHADGTVPGQARYELTVPLADADGAPLSALRIEARPSDLEVARHTPERGFITTSIKVALVQPDGTVTPLEVGRYFPDTDNFTNLTLVPLTKESPVAAADAALAVPLPGPPAPAPAPASTKEAKPTVETVASVPPAKRPPAKKATTKGGAPAKAEMRDVTLDYYFSANPTLSGPRWVVVAFKEPVITPPGAALRVTVAHGGLINSKPAPIRRLRVSASTSARWTALGGDPELTRQSERVSGALAELAKIPGTDLPVMAELESPQQRETRLFIRGNFMEKAGEPLRPGVPKLFPPWPAGQPANRLALARWFFQPGQPLTARVAVNRFWEQLFGVGIVATLEDFGSTGEKPSHPELLDWLALRFERDLRWDMKALLRELVLTAAYRQDAFATPAQLERDPQNRLLARGPRQRLSAEMIRDQALAAAGVLSAKMGGPPVMPPQPAGVWQTVYNSKDWVESKGEDRYRRAVYTFWKRSAAYPGFLTFDMPARDLCTPRRTPTNTPLQALVTLNDVVYQEAAQALAARAQRDSGADASVENRIAHAFTLVLSRPPSPAELARLRQLHDASLASLTAPGAAPPESPPDAPTPESRAMTTVAAAILNLDGAFVR